MYKNDREKVVFDLLTGMSPSQSEVQAVYDKYLSEDCVWENTGFPASKGRAATNGLLSALFSGGFQAMDQSVTNLLSNEKVVVAERYEKMLRKDGSVIVEFPITGVFEFNEQGKICAWRDYFDASLASKVFA